MSEQTTEQTGNRVTDCSVDYPADYPRQNLGDVLDRLTILTRKVAFGMEDAISEHRYLEQGLSAWDIDGKFVTQVIRLAMANFDIWNLEHEIRQGGEDRFSLEEIGKRAIAIRDLNKKRVDQKNRITEASKDGFREVKVEHRSA